MEYDSESSCEGRCLRDFEDANEPARSTEAPEICDRRNRVLCQTSAVQTMSERSRFQLNPASKSLSSQVMEYYHKYSRNSNLDHYFSLPNASQEAVKYYYSVYELSAKVGSSNRQDCIGEEYNLKSYVPRERRRWVRPPLIGQSSNADTSSRYVEPLTDPQTPSPDLKHGAPETIHEEKHESPEKLPEVSERKLSSPTSSVASYKPLEWDSGADVGYFNSHSQNRHNDKRLSTIERMALARGCSAALRLDPEGTTESGMHSGKIAAAPSGPKLSSIPDANSTPLVGNASGSESEVEITPIVKSHLPGIIAGDGIKSEERRVSNTDTAKRRATTKSSKQETHNFDTPTSSAFKMPLIKYSTTERRLVSKRKEIPRLPSSPLKKSISMNVLSASSAKSSLKRSQSDLNLHTQERKAALPLIFNSTSSIATVVNKPMTCDKVIQTSPEVYAQESVGVQVSDLDESRLPLAEGDPSAQTTIHSILKKSKGTYRVKGPRKCDDSRPVDEPDCSTGGAAKENPRHRSSSGEMSQNASTSVTPQPDETENVSGRANSFEYFPGHTYANVPNGRDSHVSSDTGRSNSTLPNSSSSINEKLWGDSDSLVRDLERSVNILKSLVDANKCDKHVKKRLIQHVIKRLVTAKYTDDRIEHNLEDNVPWNPDDARNKVYRAELLQALAKKHSTTESSDEWNLRKKDTSTHKSAGTTSDVIKEVVALESSNSDKFDRHTDRTEMDGRKARLGLRTDDCQQSGNTTTDPDKSESSECFVPQRNHKNAKVNDIFCYKDNCKLPHRESTTTNSIPPPDHNRILLDAVVNNRRTPVESNNNTDNNTDWRLPTTSSERQFELKKCSMSESGDSKLVSYAEMEKRNQLIWITNEISHLCNLKKLLEQPRRLERPKSSPRKPKSANFKSKQTTALASRRDQSAGTVHNRDTSDLHDDSVNEPWSSHCNLATCEAASDNAVQRVMKRNSCTQTASDMSDAYSKTGGEIVSACRTRSSATKGVAAGVQTPSQEMHPTPATTMPTNARDTKYTSSQSPRMRFQDNAKCRDQTCQKHTAQIVQCASCARCVNQNSSDTSATRMRKNFQGDAAPIVSQQTQTNYASDNGAASTEPAYRRAAQSNSVQYKQKEAKNQINASKSKCDCARVAHSSVNGDNKYGSNVVVEAKRAECCKKALLKVCPSCSKQKLVVEVGNGTCNCGARENNPGDGKTCARASECADVSDVANDADGRIVIGQSRQNRHADSQSRRALNFNEQNGSACDCVNDCVACRSPETTAETLRDCRSSGPIDDNRSCHFECRLKTAERQPMTPVYSDTSQDSNMIAQQQQQQQQQRKVQSSLRCDEACSCGNNQATKDIARGKACRSHATKPNFVDDSNVVNRTERSCKHCRACGAMYQNARKCDCRQTYPKAVAYELSFTKESTIQNETSDVVPITPKIPFAKQPSNPTKSEACPCDVKRNVSSKNSHQTTTLQDYLSKNNPEFVGNAETRRQYLSEICQLRELRKEKRIQLLAMASTSHIIRSAQVPKPTVCVQRKISEQEMKERLRKRYLRLNEVRFKRRQQERQEEARRNKLMAKIFCKRLQQKVLRGQVDLSQSVSVISNL